MRFINEIETEIQQSNQNLFTEKFQIYAIHEVDTLCWSYNFPWKLPVS